MAKAVTHPMAQSIRKVLEDECVRRLPDQELLWRFSSDGDEAAFRAILCRHGAMVLDVCRSVLGNEADAEDAFQATFLVFARKAGAIRKRESAGSWLHGVAYRTARRAQRQLTARRRREAEAPGRVAVEQDEVSWREVQAILHEELAGLAERYRVPLLVCYLEGRTQDEAAAQLGVATSTLKERLERGRSLLRARLMRRGVGPAAVALATAWPYAAAQACLPLALASATSKAACLAATGQALTGAVSARVALLTEGVLRTMVLGKLKSAATLLAAAAVLALAARQVSLSAGAVAGTEQARAVALAELPPQDAVQDVRAAAASSVLVECSNPVSCLAWSADGRLVAAGTDDGTVHVTEAATGKNWSFATQESGVTALALSPDGQAMELFNKLLRESTWDVASGKQLGGYFQADATSAVDHVAFVPDGKWAVGVRAGAFTKRQFVTRGPAEGVCRASAEQGDPCCAAIAPDGTVMASYSRERGVVILLQAGPADKNEFGEDSAVDIGAARCIALGPGGKLLAVGGENGVSLWDVPTQTRKQALAGLDRPADRLVISANGQTLAALAADGKSVIAWDLAGGVVLHSVDHRAGAVGALVLSPDGRKLATTTRGGKVVHLWKLGG